MHITERHSLRPYQDRGVTEVIEVLAKKPILCLPTGGGKTVCGTAIIERLHSPTLWLTHREELINQAADRLQSHGLYVGIIKAGTKEDRMASIQVASVQTLRNKPQGAEWPDSHLVVIDEAHHATADTYGYILKFYDHCPVVGLTATPFRLDGSGLGDIFGAIVAPTSTAELCADGTLHRPRVWCGLAPDLSGIKDFAGDFNRNKLAAKCNTAELTGDIVETWKRRASGEKTVAFAVNIEHSKNICEAFNKCDIRAEHIDGKTKKDDRRDILNRLANGDTSIVSNCSVLTEGWDLPSLGCAIIARPTESLNLHLQMIGRIMRSFPGKRGAIVLDHAGNHHRHGFVTRKIDFSLERKKPSHCEPLGLKRCAKCGMYFDLNVYACPDCGWTPNRAEAMRVTPPVKADGELVEISDDPEDSTVFIGSQVFNKADETLENKTSVYEALVEQGKQSMFSPGWASHEYKRIFGVWPRGVGANIKRAEMEEKWSRMIGAK